MNGSRGRERPGDGPTAARMLVGAQLRRLRDERGLTRGEAADLIRASESKISRMELGRVSFKVRDVRDLLSHYQVPERQREELLARLREASSPSWWRPYGDAAPDWFQRYLGLEATATLIRTYETQFVPGLLQTEDYARAVVRLGHTERDDDVERRVRLRLERQQLLHQPDPPTLWAVVDEATLRRPVGGVRVMRDQLEALVGIVTKVPNVRLQVVPLAVGGHAAAGGSFTILRFPHQDLPDLVYIEHLTSALYLESRKDVDHYFDAMNCLCVEAAPVARTAEILDQIIDDLDAAGS